MKNEFSFCPIYPSFEIIFTAIFEIFDSYYVFQHHTESPAFDLFYQKFWKSSEKKFQRGKFIRGGGPFFI